MRNPSRWRPLRLWFMALELRRKRRKRLSMTSLIDVIFLLLLFFMLTSTFSKFGEVELTTAAAGGATNDLPIRFIKLEPTRILIDGAAMDMDQVSAAMQVGKPQIALISLTPQVTSQQLIDLLAALRTVPKLQTQVMG